MRDLIEFIINIGFFAVLLGVGYFVGSAREKAHLKYLDQKEKELSGIFISNLKTLPPNWNASKAQLVGGISVISTDYFKTYAASLRNLFGGRIRSMETLVERARRQAIVRMLEEARAAGTNAVWNVRLETSTIGNTKGQPSSVEVIAYGTALLAE
ncbi:MAG: heavy metal-binding domain-containing protein [Candidatus Methylacidiphilales bacterium]|nr:heavy metal-binding domain-containing protein [Candidatus Methylacidiphilales bacterium]